ncbi:MAG: MoaD/ThiS family protein [Clostridia bacterium]|nr:MoaD/ThiS family protein [Clostridia bacterium]
MVTVRLFGAARVNFKDREVKIEASTVKELVDKLIEKYNSNMKSWRQFMYYVNDVSIEDLKLYKTPLKDGDVVMVVSLGTGG